MDGRHSRFMAVSAVALAMVVAGCAQRPGAAVPDGQMIAGTSATMTSATSAEPGDTTTTATAGVAYGRGERAAPKEFVSVADLADIHFDFDRADIRPDAAEALAANAQWLKAHPDHLVLIEGHTDERGSNEYNVALGDHRARSSMNYLVSRGIPATRITVVSYGEDRPVCQARQEQCWKQNRRAHFAVKPR